MDIDIIGKLNDWILFRYKIILDYFPERLKYVKLGKANVLNFEFQYWKLLILFHNTYILLFWIDVSTKPYRGLWFNRTHLRLFQSMPLKIYINFYLSSGYNFKINYLKDKMRHGMQVHILLNNLASSPLQLLCQKYCFWHRRSTSYGKTVKFYLEIEFKVFVRSTY